jgi:CDP-paratose 2-epimerase
VDILVTGSSGLIGSEAVVYFHEQGHNIIGVDNNMRASFFGPDGDTRWNLARLKCLCSRFDHYAIDIRNRQAIEALFKENRFGAIIHCAAQPSHDKAKDVPHTDFEVNALGTLNLLEAARQFSSDAPFVHVSTNKVYGDAPNELAFVELEKRWEYADPNLFEGIDESMRIDRSTHSLFGASKLAGDILAQEYGRYFGMPTVVFRGGCLTGPSHSGVELHGFLSFLVKAVTADLSYTVFGYKGKQVRDNIHSSDVVRAFEAFVKNPKPNAVYNLGGGRRNSVSILEAIAMAEALAHRKLKWKYSDQNRIGDHICYISDMGRFKADYPEWSLQHSLESILEEMVNAELKRGVAVGSA